MKLKLYQVDAFTDKLFHGNPAAVCILENRLDEELMQKIALENNLSETAFVVPKNGEYEIRWFTPATEVELCGHATLASAHVLFNHLNISTNDITFHSRERGSLNVQKEGDSLTLDFPTDNCAEVEIPSGMADAIGAEPVEAFKGDTDYLLIYESEDVIRNINPDFNKLLKVDARGVIVSAAGKNCDFVSRFFGPRCGINEDPVTGSAHTTLTPVWGNKLGKTILTAKQLYARGGDLVCEYANDRVKITGKAVTYMIAEIDI